MAMPEVFLASSKRGRVFLQHMGKLIQCQLTCKSCSNILARTDSGKSESCIVLSQLVKLDSESGTNCSFDTEGLNKNGYFKQVLIAFGY